MLYLSVMHWDFILILVILGTLIPWLGRRRVRQLMQLPGTTKLDRLTLYASTLVFQWLAAGIILWRTAAHRITPIQLGLAMPRPELITTVAIGLSVLLFASQIFSLNRIATAAVARIGILGHLARKVFPQDDVERLAFFALVITVAICEEVIYRGFAQFVFQQTTGSIVLGIFLSAVLFALAHFYQGLQGLISTFAVGLIFACARAWTGSLVPSICAHFVTDLTVGLLAPIRLRTVPSAADGRDPSSSNSDADA
jgi:membrane protease YdiL (CAAX protease family)